MTRTQRHLNGNALFAVGDRKFAAFAKSSRGAFKAYDSFDQSMFEKYQQVCLSHICICNIGFDRSFTFAIQNPKPVAHLFVYTNALQNRGYDHYNIPQFRREEPDALLCHGKGFLKSVRAFIDGDDLPHWTKPLI